MQDILQFVQENVLVISAALFVLGAFLKRVERLKHWLIPFILLPIGIALCVAVTGSVVEGITQGILVTGAAVLTNEIIKQGTERR